MSKDIGDELIRKVELLSEKVELLSEKLDVLSKLMAFVFGLPENSAERIEFKKKTKTKQIRELSKYNFPRDIIAIMVNTTPLTVSARLSEMKKKKKSKINKEEATNGH